MDEIPAIFCGDIRVVEEMTKRLHGADYNLMRKFIKRLWYFIINLLIGDYIQTYY
jgi:hypothetical protein